MFKGILLGALFVSLGLAQDQDDHHAHDMSQMAMQPAETLLMNQASGTSMNPESYTMPMIMVMKSDWNLMFMGQAFVIDTQQTGPRGADKFYSANYGMLEAEHRAGGGAFLFQTMMSLEPATVTDRRYPELFQTGETAYGRPLVDAQHPHNFVMALGVQYAHPIGENTIAQIYFAPVGDPAIGPIAFPHRASASEIPEAPLGHHLQDSSHIANEVITGALQHKQLRLELSGFYGTEPNENRWTIGYGPINSWATRLSYFPSKNWLVQASLARLTRPERQELGDVVRSTASIEYTRPMHGADWATSLIWGRDHKTLSQHNLNGYLLESVAPVRRKDFITGRVELLDKDELFSDAPLLEDQLARTVGSTFRIGAYTIGYTRDIGMFRDLESGIGVNFTTYSLPSEIKPHY